MTPDISTQPLLIVDDNEDDALLLACRLREAGVKNTQLHFRNGGDAFMFLKHFSPSNDRPTEPLPCAMFLDINMPGLSGFDILVWARQQPALAGMKIFMLSGANEQWDAQIAAKLGADEYLLKFPDKAALNTLIAGLVPAAATNIGEV